VTFEEWWQREYPYNQYERHFGGRAWQAAQAEQAAQLSALLPDSWYADRELIFRLEKLVEQWRKLHEANAEQAAEVERLKRGDFTPEEIHGLCHNLQSTVPAEEFAAGCAEYQRKLYNESPDADARNELIAHAARLERERDELRQQIETARAADTEPLRRRYWSALGEVEDVKEQCAAKDAALRQAKDDLISLARSAGLNPNGFTAQVDAALNPQPRSIAEGERGAVESEQCR